MSQLHPLKIYFILNSEDLSCEKPQEMYTAYISVLSYKGNAVWVPPSFCLQHEPEPTDVFVFDRFEGAAFQKLKQNSAKILGPRALLACVTAHEPIPPGTSPIFTEGMRGFIVCFTGFDSQTRKELQQLVEYMGGIFTKELRSRVTHVVAHNNISVKAIQAYNMKMPIMTEQWVKAVWQKSQHINISGDAEEFAIYQSPLFHNLKITTSGIPCKEKESLKNLVVQNGGTVMGTMENNITDILIIKEPVGEKYKHAQSWRIEIVHPSWIHECVKLNRIVKMDGHRISTSEMPKMSTPTKNIPGNLTVNFSCVSAIEVENDRNVMHCDESTNSSFFPTPGACHPLKPINTNNKTPKKTTASDLSIILNQIQSQARSAGLFLDGCNIFLSGFNQEQFERLKKILNQAGATRFDELTPAVTHIIWAGPVNADVLKDQGDRVLPLQWLLESAKLGNAAPIDKYQNQTENRMSEPPSPLSQQGAKLLHRPEPKKLSFISNNEDTLQLRHEDDDLLQRYGLSQQEPPMQPIDSKKDNDMNQQEEEPMESLPDFQKSLPPDQLFCGLRFYLSSDLTDEEALGIKEEITSCGGQIVPKYFRGVPDYAVVPIISTPMSSITARDVVNILYIKDCCLTNAIIPLQYYHHPISPVKGSAPLSGCVISASQYLASERDFVETLIEALGAVMQSSLTRRKMKDVLKTTHLVCAEPTGQKYNGAIRWGLPVVHHEWLLKCAEVGKKVPEDPYLVGESKKLKTPDKNDPKVGIKTPLGGHKGSCNDLILDSTKRHVAPPVRPLTSPPSNKTNPLSSPDKSQRIKTPLFHSEADTSILRAVHTDKSTPVALSNSGDKISTNAEGAFSGSNHYNRQPKEVIPIETECSSKSFTPNPIERVRVGAVRSPKSPSAVATRIEKIRADLTPSQKTSSRSAKDMDEWISRGADFPLEPSRNADNRRNSTPILSYLRAQANLLKRSCDDVSQNFSPVVGPDAKRPRDLSREPALQTSDFHNGLRKIREIEASISPQMQLSKPVPPPKDKETACMVETQAESQPQTEIGWDVPPVTIQTKKFMISALGKEVDDMIALVKSCGGEVSVEGRHFDPTATHIIIGNLSRAEKLLGSIASGLWVLHPSYLEQLAKVGNVNLLQEEDYEWGNPKLVARYDSLSTQGRSAAQSSYQWRRDIHYKNIPKPFSGLHILLNTQKEKQDSFKRILEAGGGKVIHENEVTPLGAKKFYISETIDNSNIVENYAKKGFTCLTISYISDIILRHPNPIENNLLPAYADYLKRK